MCLGSGGGSGGSGGGVAYLNMNACIYVCTFARVNKVVAHVCVWEVRVYRYEHAYAKICVCVLMCTHSVSVSLSE